MNGFEDKSTKTLLQIRANLLEGLDKVADSIKNKTFKKTGPKGEASPAQSGNLTLALLEGVEAVLKDRGEL